MKKGLFLTSALLAMLAMVFFQSCGGKGAGNLTREDSLKICDAIMFKEKASTTLPRTDTNLKTHKFQSIFDPATIITPAQALNYHHQYLQNPIGTMVNRSNDMVRGFFISKSDLKAVYDKGKNGARIYLGFNGNEYNLMLVGVGADNANDLTAIIDEFFPCPDQCPDVPAGETATVRKKVYENDLNYLRTEGDEVVFMTFGNQEVRRRWR